MHPGQKSFLVLLCCVGHNRLCWRKTRTELTERSAGCSRASQSGSQQYSESGVDERTAVELEHADVVVVAAVAVADSPVVAAGYAGSVAGGLAADTVGIVVVVAARSG